MIAGPRPRWREPGSIPGKSGLQPATSFRSAALFASRLLVQCIKAVHFGHVSPPPRAHILCTGVRFSSENREPHALHVNIGGAAGPFSCWFETIGCGGLGGTFKAPTCSVFRLLDMGALLYVLLRGVLTTCLRALILIVSKFTELQVRVRVNKLSVNGLRA